MNVGRRFLPAENPLEYRRWGVNDPTPGPGDWFKPRPQGVVHAPSAGEMRVRIVRSIVRVGFTWDDVDEPTTGRVP